MLLLPFLDLCYIFCLISCQLCFISFRFLPFYAHFINFILYKGSIFFQNNKDFYIFFGKKSRIFLFFAHYTLQTGGIFIAKKALRTDITDTN